MSLQDRSNLQQSTNPLELDDIQALVLRDRPEPYYGTHGLLHINNDRDGRELIRRLLPHIDSAADWRRGDDTWTGVGLTYAGLAALGVPNDSLKSFPEAFRQGMAERAEQLLDYGLNAPEHWELPFGSGQIHVWISTVSSS